MNACHYVKEHRGNRVGTKALFFSVGNLGCGMGECGKGGKKWVRVGKNGIFF